MAKKKEESKTILYNDISNILNAIAFSVLAVSEELREAVPFWVYILLMVISNTVNRYLRTKTTEPIE